MNPNKLKAKLKELGEEDLLTSWSKEELWTSVEARLARQHTNSPFFHVGRIALPWAAAVLFSVGIYWWSSKNPEVQLATETVAELDLLDEDFEVNADLSEGKELIHETCTKQLEICQSAEFKNLYEELLQIEEEKILLEVIVEQYGSDETAIKAMIQLENVESSITGKLIALIMT